MPVRHAPVLFNAATILGWLAAVASIVLMFVVVRRASLAWLHIHAVWLFYGSYGALIVLEMLRFFVEGCGRSS